MKKLYDQLSDDEISGNNDARKLILRSNLEPAGRADEFMSFSRHKYHNFAISPPNPEIKLKHTGSPDKKQ